MKRKIDPEDNASNIPNPNHGTNGTNRQYDQNKATGVSSSTPIIKIWQARNPSNRIALIGY